MRLVLLSGFLRLLVELNIDGAFIEGVTAGCGGLVRDENGFLDGTFC